MSRDRHFPVKFFAARISDGNRTSESLILYGMKILQLSAVFILPEIAEIAGNRFLLFLSENINYIWNNFDGISRADKWKKQKF